MQLPGNRARPAPIHPSIYLSIYLPPASLAVTAFSYGDAPTAHPPPPIPTCFLLLRGRAHCPPASPLRSRPAAPPAAHLCPPRPAPLRFPGGREGPRAAPRSVRIPHLSRPTRPPAGVPRFRPAAGPSRASRGPRGGPARPALPPLPGPRRAAANRRGAAGPSCLPNLSPPPVGEPGAGGGRAAGARRRHRRGRGGGGRGSARGAEQSAEARRGQMTAWPAGSSPARPPRPGGGTPRSYLTMTPRRSPLGHPGVSR